MEQLIANKLHEIEKNQNVRILLAVESGSRAWGFASPDSDYDLRFIYIRAKDDYLRLDSVRDVIELPITDLLDINGWDLKKALGLLYKSNPTLFEWLSSPIVYRGSDFIKQFRSIINDYFSAKKGLHHYLSMAESNYREYLKLDMVKAKKYFYVLRPVLACRWILDRRTPPPVLFSKLMETELPGSLSQEVCRLLEIKAKFPEIKEIPKVHAINEYIDLSVEEIKYFLQSMQEEKTPDWQKINSLFLQQLEG